MNSCTDFGLVLGPLWNLLGASWAPLGVSWGLFGASRRLLDELLDASCDLFMLLRSDSVVHYVILKTCLFLEREHHFQHLGTSRRPLGGFLAPLEGLLGALVGVLKCLRRVLAASWGLLGAS